MAEQERGIGEIPVHSVKRSVVDTLSELLGESATESLWTMSPRHLVIRDRD